MATIQKRQIAVKARIETLLNNEFVKKEGWEPSYILKEKTKLSRVNIIATIISKEGEPINQIVIDDGSGRINVRSFDDEEFGQQMNIGEVALLVGRPREYGSERYLLGEIIKKVENKDWIKIRELELKYEKPSEPTEKVEEKAPNTIIEIVNIIRELDDGDGANYEEVLTKTKGPEADNSIKNLLQQGEIFEIKPGKLKILI